MAEGGYRPIEDYGMIGDMHTVALVSRDGSIDWCCLPRFDAPSVFARLLDADRGGHFQIRSRVDDAVTKQFYWPETNVLVTRFLSDEGVGEVRDFMPVRGEASETSRRKIVRTVRAVRGTTPFRLECRPAFDYGRAGHEVDIAERGVCFRAPDAGMSLAAEILLERDGSGVVADFTLTERETTTLVLREMSPDEDCGPALSPDEAERAFRDTVQFWRDWVSQCTYRGRWRETVHRSALALKLLTYQPTGAIVAAPTTSLPEEVGGVRNWDYRYTWIRDAAFTLYAFLRVGFTGEARAFMEFLAELCSTSSRAEGPLQIMYGIDGRTKLTEETLDHLEGYRGSRPVRIGNGAFAQRQLDIYGEVVDSIYIYDRHGVPISHDLWGSVREFVEWVCGHWQEADESIWEMRGGQQQFVFSKLMCWVAIDRALRIAERRSLPADRSRWRACRDAIYATIMERGWDEELGAFTQQLDRASLDASNLMMPLVLFLSPADERLHRTLDAAMRSPDRGGLVSNGLVYRYNLGKTRDGLEGQEGTFNICTFWLVEALTRAGRSDPSRLEEARLTFEHMLGHANHVGLFAEQTGRRGEALGNFPQAFTHLALISAAYDLDRTLDGAGRK